SGKPFIMTGEATVGADGRFRAVFNFTGIDAGTTFEVTVRRDDGTLATTEGVVVDCGKRPDASVCRDQPTETAKPNGTETATPAETGTTTRTSAEPTATRIGTQVPESHDSDWLVVFGLLGVGGVFGIVGVALLLGVVEI
ncbi:MAG: BGTF surface domain-containing protein, partial [Halobaculum sp.]